MSSWPEVLGTLLRGEDLDSSAASWAMREIIRGDATAAQVAAFAVALRAKGESAAEIAGLAGVMLAEAPAVSVPGRVVDTCGTGGDQAGTVNISTMAAIVVAGAGVPVVKHGGRAASSACGSADLLAELGVVVDLPAETVARSVAEAGAAFCFAPVFHPGMRHAAGPRRELGIPTVFNVLGPLTNPARPAAQVVGVAHRPLAPVMAAVLAARGGEALVFRGVDGLDELSVSGPSEVWVVAGGAVEEVWLEPGSLGVGLAEPAALRGGDAAANAAVARRVLAGERGAAREAVLLNAAAALAVHAGEVRPLVPALRRGLARATESVDSGAAAAALRRWVEVSQRLRR